jgi:hypothetical protein
MAIWKMVCLKGRNMIRSVPYRVLLYGIFHMYMENDILYVYGKN